MILSPIQELIKQDINARAEHSRLFELHDWGLVGGDTLTAALDSMDTALIALCAARPATPADADLRKEYLTKILVDRLDGCRELLKEAMTALISAGGVA